MEPTRSERALRRGLAYQYWSGLPRTLETETQVLESILKTLRRGDPDLLAAVMAELRSTAPDNTPTLPESMPAIRRGSLHYGDY